MPTRVVVYDPDGALPSSFACDAELGSAIVQLDRTIDLQRIGRKVNVLILVAGHDKSAALGFLAATRGQSSARLVLFVADARRHRRLVIRAARHGATLLIGQTPCVLTACLRDLIAPRPLSRDAEWACRAAAASFIAGMPEHACRCE